MTASCRVCGRQVEVSDSGQPMPCVCVTERRKRDEPGLIGAMAQDRRNPLAAVIAQCVADCVGPAAPEQPELVQFDADDVRGMREQWGDCTWADFAAAWESFDRAEPSLGAVDVPHLFAVRFIERYRREGLSEPFDFYLALREAFFQAMTVVADVRDPGTRWFK